MLARILQGLAAILAASLVVTALHDVSTTWDVWYYHLPFAARIWGIVPEGAYVFHAANRDHYAGFPLLAEALQGLLWRVTGRPEAANLVALGALALYAWFLRRVFRVPPHLAALGLLAIPLVQLHATSCYIDLPGNLCASVLVLLVARLYTTAEPPSDRALLGMALGAGGAANMRFQLHPLVLVALLAAAPRVLGPLARDLRGPARRSAQRRILAIAVALPLVFATPLRNLIVHHNPYYPMRLALGPLALPGHEDAYSHAPRHLADAPRALRWLHSVLEIGVRPMTETRRWTIDQWAPSDSTADRMGGFFGAYVVFHAAWLALRAARDRRARKPALAFLGLTVMSAMLPQSHELRYYMYWMILLVSLNLALACLPDEGAARRLCGPTTLGVACAVALAVVLGVTRAGYAYPSGSTFAELVAGKVDAATLERVRTLGRACLSREPWTILYAAPFHPGPGYVIREAEGREACEGDPWIE